MRNPRQIAVIGAEGQLGAELCRQLAQRGVGLTRQQCNLLEADQVAEVLRQLRPAAVINTAAYTAVDRAEQEPVLCRAINADAVTTLAELCEQLNCTLVQISTDYVFGADRTRAVPYRETDTPGPVNVYGESKLAGERAAANWRRHYVFRTCGLYGRRNKPGQANFVDTMLRLARERNHLRIVSDQHCTPSYVPHVARGILEAIKTDAFGTYHLVQRGATTWYEFAQEIFRMAKVSIQVEPITSEQYAAPAERPRYGVLNTDKYHALGTAPMPDWQTALAEYLAER